MLAGLSSRPAGMSFHHSTSGARMKFCKTLQDMSRPSQLHQVKLKITDPTENKPAHCVRLFTTTCSQIGCDYMLVLNIKRLALRPSVRERKKEHDAMKWRISCFLA